MFRAVAVFGLVIISGALGCAGMTVEPTSAQDAKTWRVVRRSSGGITGLGVGNLAVTSEGELQVLPSRRTGAQGSGSTDGDTPVCTVKLTADQMARISPAVAGAKPGAWKTRYFNPKNPSGCCDFFAYELTLEWRDARGAMQRHATSWTDNDSEDWLPADIVALKTALNDLHAPDACPQ